ncbi:MAG TPA: hypothetical protein VFQ67_01660 [Allosphingosinicella sp.]|jgi:kojibiose phosphorylase|nr:hypothetical protein [Allosphingosinicella sp.]
MAEAAGGSRLIADREGLTQLGHLPEEEAWFESLFALSNGALGARATVDMDSETASPGAFHAGIYAPGLTVPLEIVNLPNWTGLSLASGGREAPSRACGEDEFRRRLVYGAAILHTRRTIDFGDGTIVRLTRRDLVHASIPSLALSWGHVRVLRGGGPIDIVSTIDLRRGNSPGGGIMPSARMNHCRSLRRTADRAGGLRHRFAVRGTGLEAEVASLLSVEGPCRWSSFERLGLIAERFSVELREGEAAAFRRLVRVAVAREGDGEPMPSADARVFSALVAAHKQAWSRRWGHSDLEIEGDGELDSRLQFGRFHLVQSMPAQTAAANIPARGLTSEYHSGHFFFNTELFKLPFFLLTEPDRARALLLHRWERLEAARRHARETGHEGARFPEESDIAGNPAAPHRLHDVYTGTTIVEWSGQQTKFISAVVALAAHWYLLATSDRAFASGPGADLLVETARFALSVAPLDQATGERAIGEAMCADEYHYGVANDAFTNLLIRQNLLLAAALGGPEAGSFRRAAGEVRMPRIFGDGVLEQFDGYAALEDELVEAWDANGRPAMTCDMRRRSDSLACFSTRLIKEGDVVLVHDVLPELYPVDQQRRDFDFYHPRTTMESSLAATPYAVVAARLDKAELARRLLMLSAGFNIDYRPRADYRNGIHLAAAGGAWRTVWQGFLGQIFSDDRLDLSPRVLPVGIRAIRARGCWHGTRFVLRRDQASLLIRVDEDSVDPLRLRVRLVAGVEEAEVQPGGVTTFSLDRGADGKGQGR